MVTCDQSHSTPSLTMEIDADALTRMFTRYWMCTGDALRKQQSVISSGSGRVQSGRSGAG